MDKNSYEYRVIRWNDFCGSTESNDRTLEDAEKSLSRLKKEFPMCEFEIVENK